MRKVIRSRWFPPLLVLALALFVAHCGNESDVVVDQELQCLGQDFPGGGYTFTVNSVSNDCGLDALIDQLVGPGDQFAVVLPAAQELPTTTDITFDDPRARPGTTRISPRLITLRMTSLRSAPRAMRMPISRVRT